MSGASKRVGLRADGGEGIRMVRWGNRKMAAIVAARVAHSIHCVMRSTCSWFMSAPFVS